MKSLLLALAVTAAQADLVRGRPVRYDDNMKTTTLWPDMAEPNEFESTDEPTATAGLFADVVFDRPMDIAYTYAVPAALASVVAVGKRVEAPFGRSDGATVGYW